MSDKNEKPGTPHDLSTVVVALACIRGEAPLLQVDIGLGSPTRGVGGFSFATQAVDLGDQQISTIACPSASKLILKTAVEP